MLLRRKTSSSSYKNSGSNETVLNGRIESLVLERERQEVIQDSDLSTASEEAQGQKEGKTGRETSSTPKGLAHTRKTSRECVIPENIDLSQLKITESPTFKIEDFSFDDKKTSRNSRPITLRRIQSEQRDCISIRELSESPQRYGVGCVSNENTPPTSRLSVGTPQDSVDGDHAPFQTPSSPLLVAMRTAVDSLNQYEDFEILEEIGAGFFAQVFKVRSPPPGKNTSFLNRLILSCKHP